MKDKLSSRAEKRKQKQEGKAKKRKAKSVKFSSSMENLVTKTVKIAPIPELDLKVVKVQEQPIRNKFVYLPNEEAFSMACHLTWCTTCLLYTSPSPRDRQKSRMPSSA